MSTRLDDLWDAAKQLYHDAPYWRFALWGAVAATAFTVIFPPGDSPPGGGPPITSTYAPPPIPTGPRSAMPSPPPSAATGPITPVTPADFESDQRLRSLLVNAGVIASELRPGAKCERLVQAVQPLAPNDRARANAQAVQVLQEADACRIQLDASDQRLATLKGSAAAVRQDESGRTLEALARSGAAITDFDRSRAQAERYSEALAEAQQAQQLVAASDRRIAALTDAAAGGQSEAPLQAQERMAEAFRALRPVDQSRLDAMQQETYAAGQQVSERLRASDSRLSALTAALEAVQELGSDANRLRLIEAVARLSGLDQQRATETQRAAIEGSRVLARTFSLEALVDLAARFETGPTVADHEQLAAIRRALGPIDRAQLTADQRQALTVADRAAQRLTESDRRLADMATAAEAWRRNPGSAHAMAVTEGYEALTEFDRQRFKPEQRRAFEQLEMAYFVVAGRTLSFTPATKTKLPIFVTAAEAQGEARATYLAAFQSALQAGGFLLARDRSSAALILEIGGAVTSQGAVVVGNTTLQGARTELALRSYWAVDGTEYLRLTERGNGVGSTADIAAAQSYQRAAGQLYERFDRHIQQRGKS